MTETETEEQLINRLRKRITIEENEDTGEEVSVLNKYE